MASSTAKLRQEIKALSGVDIMLDSKTFKSTYQIMEELAAKWQDLTDIQQASVTELIAGKRQGNIVSSLMNNFDIAEQALETSLNSAGSAMKEHEKWQESLEARINKLKAAWQSLSQSFMSSDFLKIALDVVIKFVDVLDKLINKIGALPTLLGGFSLFTGISQILSAGKIVGGLSSFKGLLSVFKDAANIIPILTKAFPNLAKGIGVFKNSLNIAGIIGQFSAALGGSAGATGLAKAAIVGKGALSGLWTVIAAHPIMAAVGAVVAAVAIFNKFTESAKELKERIEDVTTGYKEQHDSLKKLKGDYDSSNEDSMISKYGRLSKGVNDLGENVSLTADEYSEYRSIVDTIAEQIPSLVIGYNSQGDAILGCAGSVDELTKAYKNLINEQNNEVLKNGNDIFKDFKNDLRKTSAYYKDDYETIDKIGNSEYKEHFDTKHLDTLKSLITLNGNDKDIETLVNELSQDEITRISGLLGDYGIKRDVLGSGEKGFETQKEHIIRALNKDKAEIKKILNEASKDLNAYAEDLGVVTEAYFSDAFLGGNEEIGDYSHFSDRMKNIINQITSSFDSGFYAEFLSKDNPYEALTEYFSSMLSAFDDLSSSEAQNLETAFSLKTQFNGGDISYGEYVNGLQDVAGLVDRMELDDEVKSQIKLALNTDEVVKDYDSLTERLVSDVYAKDLANSGHFSGISVAMEDATNKAREFLNGLTASEYAVAVDLIANDEIDFSDFNIDSLREYIEEQAKINEAMAFTTDIEVDTTALEKLNEILAESASAMGLSEESIDSLKAKYSELDGYNPSTLFERTTNGIKVNRQELEKLEKQHNDLTKTKVKEHLETLVNEYNDVTKEIDKCTNAGERAELLSKRETYKNQIEELAEYEAQLEGVTGAYKDWIDAQSGPEDYEGYESVATSREDIEDEISRGFLGNKSKKYIDLLSGEDLDGGSIDDYANAWSKLDDKVTGAGHSINDFFTVNEDGDITSTGIDRFFKSIRTDFKDEVYKLNEETGEWYYDFSQENLQKIQDEWGIGIDAIGLLLEAAAAAGYNVDWDGILDNIDFDTSNFETLVSYAESAQSELNKLKGYENLKFNFTTTNVKDATAEIEKAQSAYNKLIDPDNNGKVNLEAEGAEQMRVILSTLLVQKQQLEDSTIAINIDTSGLDESQHDIANAIEAVKTFREKYKNLEIAVTTGQGIDTAKSELSKAMGELQTLGGEGVDIAAQLILGEGTDGETLKTKVDAAITAVGDKNIKVGCKLDETAIGDLNSQVLTNFTPEATVKITGIDDALVNQYTSTEKTAEGTVKWKNDESLVVEYQEKTKKAVGIVDWANNTDNVKKSFSANGTVKWTSGNKVKVDVISEANGTANANGSSVGRAFARGNWGIKGSGTALGGELGQELIVRDGKFFTIGDSGAEFFRYKPNDIIFNAAQTESLLKYGGIKGAKPRGTMLASGTAFADGSTQLSGRAFVGATASGKSSLFDKAVTGLKNLAKKNKSNKTVEKSVSVTVKENVVDTGPSATVSESNTTKNRNSKSPSASSSSVTSSSSVKDEFKETIDWIEIAISRIEREIDNLDKKANNVYKTWSSRNSALTAEIQKVGNEIELQNNAYDRYIKEANSVGLSSSWAEKVRNGEIDIDTIKDENLADKIKSYQDYYEKAIDCKDAIEELKETEASLYVQRVENVATQYEGILGVIEHEKNMLEEYISQSEAQAWLVSANYYNALANNEKDNIAQLKKEKTSMLSELQNAMESGTIAKGSESWYEMVNAVDEVTLAIAESETALLEYQQTIQQSGWEVFDILQDKISSVTDEADFLIELLSNDKLYDDNGQLTAVGKSTMGLHGQNYNVNMYQADQAAAEAERLKKELAKDPFDTELEKRYREMISLQQEHILAAEDEKNAIRDMVEEGIELELEALQERIDKYEEALDSQKDLYDYQKRVKEQTEEIASLEKQMAAYSGDTSEEAKSKVQELKVSLEEAKADLEETEYDKYISDQKQLLDELYLSYEEILNMRLDNVDALVSDMIAEINNDSAIIENTIRESADSVGYTLSDSMQTIWSSNAGNINGVITTYGEKFTLAQTTTNNALNVINTNLQNMITQLNKLAKTNVKSASTSSAANSKEANATKKEEPKKEPVKEPVAPTIKVGGMINASGAPIYDYAGDTSGEGQYYRNDPKYKVLDEQKGYLLTRWYKLTSGYTGWFKKSDVKALATGAKRIMSDDMAWTQEKGQEYIVRPSDGAILTPVAKGDSVLNAQASRNIWNMANSPAEFIKNNLGLDRANVPNNSNIQTNYTQHLDKVVFNLPNVKNYDELLSEMQKDKNFERLINSMTIDRIAGKSSLAKGKSIR